MHSFTCPKCGTFYNADVTFGDRVECECCLFKFTVPEKSIRTRYPIPVQKLVLKNPFRVMGVYAGASAKEISATTNKAKAFLKVGKSLSFPVDIGFPPLERSQELFEGSEAQLVLPAERLSAAVTWLNADDDPIGRAILRAISEEDKDAIRHFSETANLPIQRKVNIAVSHLLEGYYDSWLNCIATIISSPAWPRYVERICGMGVTVTPDNFAETLIPSIRNVFSEDDLSDLTLLNAGGVFAEFAGKALRQKFDHARGRIKGENALKELSIAESIIQTITPTVLLLNKIEHTNPGLQRAADTLGHDLLQAAIAAHNQNRKSIDIMQRCFKVVQNLLNWPLGHLISQRIEDNARTIQSNIRDEIENGDFNQCAEDFNDFFEDIRQKIDNSPNTGLNVHSAVNILYSHITDLADKADSLENVTRPSKIKEKSIILQNVAIAITGIVFNDFILLGGLESPLSVSRGRKLLEVVGPWIIAGEALVFWGRLYDAIKEEDRKYHPTPPPRPAPRPAPPPPRPAPQPTPEPEPTTSGGSGCCIPLLIGLSIPSILGVFLFFCFH